MSDPFQVTRDFEAALCEYTGAPYAVAVNSCTMAILLACAWMQKYLGNDSTNAISLPKLTYVGVPYAVREALPHADILFRDEDWQGEYQIKPLPVWDSARRFTEGMWSRRAKDYWRPGGNPIVMQTVSFHVSKILGASQGGAILHNDARGDGWLRRARFDGRTEGVAIAEGVRHEGRAWHCYISPDVSAALLWKLSALPRVNADLPRSDYPDLSKFPAFA
jgi:dTDP-4-amino-4,6-dideoxygalactose transaminase